MGFAQLHRTAALPISVNDSYLATKLGLQAISTSSKAAIPMREERKCPALDARECV